jgi:hypothetical protein
MSMDWEVMTHEIPRRELTYNLFRRKGRSRLHCAVPQDWHVPAFINDKAWDFVGAVSEHAVFGAVGAYSGLLVVPRPLYLSPLRRTSANALARDVER